MEHLIGLGHRRIGFIEGLPQLSTSRERLQGYRQALEEHGISFDPSLVRQGDSRQESGRELTRELLELPDRPTALLVGNNLMTLGALVMIHQKALRIPEDVAILGYDDMPWALALNPPLTAVRQPGDEVGRRAMELLLQRIREPQRSVSLVMMQPELVVRKSCGAGVRKGAGVRRAG
jgi:LacI family transcriptional regulator/LacI family repressor for deo operon, udp, cdd, tsx, nupC, and nupG